MIPRGDPNFARCFDEMCHQERAEEVHSQCRFRAVSHVLTQAQRKPYTKPVHLTAGTTGARTKGGIYTSARPGW